MQISDYLSHLKMRQMSPHSILAAKGDLSAVEGYMGRPLIEATEADIRKYLLSVCDLKASTIRRRLASLNMFFRVAVRHGYTHADPMANIEAPKLPQRLPVHLQPDEVARLINAELPADAHSLRDVAIVKTLFFTGMRIGELQGLTMADIDWSGRQLRIIGKGNKERRIPISQALFDVLLKWTAIRSTACKGGPPSLFVTITGPAAGRGLRHDALALAVRNGLQSMGIDPARYSPHKLRHSCATELLRRGVPLEQISHILGHSKLDTTLIYAHLDQSKVRAALDLLA
jgi:integrase/recombinase XerC